MNLRHRFFSIAFFSLFFSYSFSEDIPFTGEEPPAPYTKITEEDLVKIETPKFISPRGAKSPEEENKIKFDNEIWQQYQKDLERYAKIKNLPPHFPIEKIRELPVAFFYTYTVKNDSENYLDTFNGLYARLQQKQGTLATINHISSPDDVKPGMNLILPLAQGLFIPKKANSTLEILLQKEYASQITEKTHMYEIKGEEFYFLPEKSFSQTQIAFFHDKGMILPLSKKIVTSEFGYRTSPISGTWKFHAGIDLAAPIGTEVYACKSGTVVAIADKTEHPLYGKYIDIQHNGNTTSRYAHLSQILVRKGQTVSTGQTIGLVGTTGASTGPHLHFEVRENGTPTDPTKQIKNWK
ncbi:MAG: M23 family metallopeptidase [Treponema sp.]|nr:M23 family metallopeptidase [Treponema sp.]